MKLSADRALLASSAVIALLAIVARLHNVIAYPAMYDWDASGHAVNVVDLLERHLPNLRSWCGSHPPLYYALSALLWILVPDVVPVHVTMRLLSVGAWTATVGLVWRSLRRSGSPVDAAVVAALLLGVPGFTIATCMMTNDALCAFFVTATLVRCLETPRGEVPSSARAASTGVLAGLAAMSKATGVAAVGIAVAFYAWRACRDWRRGWRPLLAVGAMSAAVTGAYYARLFFSLSGSPYAILAVRAGSQEKEAVASIVNAVAQTSTPGSSFASFLHTALWGDPTAVYLPQGVGTHLLARTVWMGGLLVTVVAVAGVVRFLIERAMLRRAAVVLVFAVSYTAALVPHVVDRPYIVGAKMNYLLPEALPLGIVLAAALRWAPGGWRTTLRVVLLAVAAAGVRLTVYGWWPETPPSASAPIVPSTRAAAPAVAAVERYFQYRARDPVRALRLLAPQVQLAHGLTLVRILGLPALASEPGFPAEDERSLELARARVAWLELYNLVRWMQPIAAALDVDVLEANEGGDTADVQVRIAPLGTTSPAGGHVGMWPFPPFDQRFTLERHDGGWMITRVEQSGVSSENAVEAFVARPTLAAFEDLRTLGWKPPWEAAIASVLYPSR